MERDYSAKELIEQNVSEEDMENEDICKHGVDLMEERCEPCKKQSLIDERANEDNGV